ncbi:MAG: cobalamin B12-binding domain-containing protein [Rhodobacteraceae bacterium]|nr:cobalamin B12-binding domain-containing protein [Paracoccaceae bacterium]
MSDGPKAAISRMPDTSGAVATQGRDPGVIPVVAALGPVRVTPDERHLRALEAAVLSPERDAGRRAVAEMRRRGIAWEAIADVYIPEVSRRLGERWCEDSLSFAEVTIGSARLQAMLRELGPEWSEEALSDPLAPNVILIVCRDDAHTLGAMVVAGQLRRARISTRLSLGQTDEEIIGLLDSKRFDAVLVSASASVRLESVRDLVKRIRLAVQSVAPIALGGSILDTDRDAKAITGVDHATCDVREALRLCGLTTCHPAGGRSATRS